MSDGGTGIARFADWLAGWIFALAIVFELLRRERRTGRTSRFAFLGANALVPRCGPAPSITETALRFWRKKNKPGSQEAVKND